MALGNTQVGACSTCKISGPTLDFQSQICICNFCSPCILQLKRATSGPGILHCLQIIISGDANVAGPWAEYTLSSKQAEDTQLQKFNFFLNKMRFLLSGSRGCFYFPFLSMGSISARRVLNRMLAPSVWERRRSRDHPQKPCCCVFTCIWWLNREMLFSDI